MRTEAPNRWNDIPPDERLRLLEKHNNGTLEHEDILATGMNPETLKRRLRELRQALKFKEFARNNEIRLPDQSTRRWTDFPVITTENAIIISDLETPDVDLIWMETVLLVGMARGIRHLIILGDLHAGDQPGLATHIMTWQETGVIDYASSVGMLKKLIEIFLLWFERIDCCSGNHDQRIAKATGGQVHLGMLFERFGCRVSFSRYRKLYIKTHRGYVACYHQANFSDNGLNVGRKMYEKENWQRSHPYAVVITHIHHWTCGKSKDDLCEIYSLGASRDPELTQYINETPTTHAQWSQSMLVMQDGFFENLERYSTNWRRVLGEFSLKARICA